MLALKHPERVAIHIANATLDLDDDALSAARGIMNGVLFSSVFWVALVLWVL